jgi:hypothetical protein
MGRSMTYDRYIGDAALIATIGFVIAIIAGLIG